MSKEEPINKQLTAKEIVALYRRLLAWRMK